MQLRNQIPLARIVDIARHLVRLIRSNLVIGMAKQCLQVAAYEPNQVPSNLAADGALPKQPS